MSSVPAQTPSSVADIISRPGVNTQLAHALSRSGLRGEQRYISKSIWQADEQRYLAEDYCSSAPTQQELAEYVARGVDTICVFYTHFNTDEHKLLCRLIIKGHQQPLYVLTESEYAAYSMYVASIFYPTRPDQVQSYLMLGTYTKEVQENSRYCVDPITFLNIAATREECGYLGIGFLRQAAINHFTAMYDMLKSTAITTYYLDTYLVAVATSLGLDIPADLLHKLDIGVRLVEPTDTHVTYAMGDGISTVSDYIEYGNIISDIQSFIEDTNTSTEDSRVHLINSILEVIQSYKPTPAGQHG